MYHTLLLTHSILRYFVFIALVVVIVKSLLGMMNKEGFGKWDNKLSLYLMIFTHLQLVAGLVLYFVSPWVRFSGGVMGDKLARYWTVEHLVGMLIAVVLITIARTTSKRMQNDYEKHKRLFLFNLIALFIIVTIILLGDRGLFAMSVQG
jgi:hypothetical protein